MKIENVFAVIVAVLAPGLAALGQTPAPPSPVPPPIFQTPSAGPQAPGVAGAPGTNAPEPEPAPPPLPEGRSVSYAPLVGPDTISNNAPVTEEAATDVKFNEAPLTEAITTLAVNAGLNIQFDPSLLVAPDGHPLTPPTVSEKWHNLTAMQALQALLDNWGWQLVWDPSTKVGRITKKNPAAKEPLVVAVIQLRYSNPTNIVREVESTLSAGSAIVPDVRTHQLIVRTTVKELNGVEALITKLDSATREVLVEAKVIQTSKDINSAKGVDWTGTLQAQHISFGNGVTQRTQIDTATTASGTGSTTTSPGGSPITGGTSPLTTINNITTLSNGISGLPAQGGGFSLSSARGFSPSTALLNADGVQAVLSFLNTDNDSKTIAAPRTVALDGVPTELMVVQNIPVFMQTQSAPASGASQGLATIQPDYELKVQGTILNEVGVKLRVTPRIAGPTNVLMELKPEISQQLPGLVTETLNGQVNQAPAFSRSSIVTEASVPSGYTLVLGGLDQDIVNKTMTKVPFFGDIPGLGSVFRSNSKDHSAERILIFVTPTIISDADYQASDSRFLERKPESPPNVKDSAWDSAQPYDWTKPKKQDTAEFQP